jgi:hypothetical protein
MDRESSPAGLSENRLGRGGIELKGLGRDYMALSLKYALDELRAAAGRGEERHGLDAVVGQHLVKAMVGGHAKLDTETVCLALVGVAHAGDFHKTVFPGESSCDPSPEIGAYDRQFNGLQDAVGGHFVRTARGLACHHKNIQGSGS